MKRWTYVHNADFVVEHKFRMLTEKATIQSLSRKVNGGKEGIRFSRWKLSTNLQLRMIIYSALIVLLCVALSYIYQNRAEANTVRLTSNSDSIRIVHIQLEGWEDNKIEYARQSLQTIPGVVEVKLEPAAHRAIIRMNIERTNLRMIDKSLHRAGFTASYQ